MSTDDEVFEVTECCADKYEFVNEGVNECNSLGTQVGMWSFGEK